MDTHATQSPTIVDGPDLWLAGMHTRHTPEDPAAFAALWQRFMPYMDKVPRRVGEFAFGVCSNWDGNGQFEYFAGVAVSDVDALPAPLAGLHLAMHRYAVFTHHGHISQIGQTWEQAYREWLPAASRSPADAPAFERYDYRFDPATGNGEVEIWIPIGE